MEARTSRRLSQVECESDSDADVSVESWGPEDGNPAPTDDPSWTKEDQVWRKAAVNKHVYFRWSTAFNSKNRFKGVVTEHVSRKGPKGNRLDYLTIKTFGISEDRYRMGKDIRELLVLPNKTSLMETSNEDQLRDRSVRKWNVRDPGNGWTESSNADSMATMSTQATTPVVEPVKKARKVVKLPAVVSKIPKIKETRKYIKKASRAETEKPKDNAEGIYIHSKHGKRTLAGSLLFGKFSFFN
jgi:hypothetical protein